MLDNTQAVVAIAVGGVVLLTALFGWWRRRLWPRWKRTRAKAVAAWDSIVGRDAVVDSITGKELAPALPGVGVRLDNLTDAVVQLGDQRARLDVHDVHFEHVDVQIEDHSERLARLEAAAVERVVTKAESAAAWRAVEAVANHQSDQIESD